jgi:hypothetical protein
MDRATLPPWLAAEVAVAETTLPMSDREIQERLRMPRLPKDVHSLQRPGHVHPAGTPVVVVETLPTSLLVEIRTYDPALEGDGWYETLEIQEPLG